MQNIITIFRKEVAGFFNSLVGYIALGAFLVLTGLFFWVFNNGVLYSGLANMDMLFGSAPYLFLFLIPAITMKSFAEEKRNGTIELLYTLPFRDIDIVMGKFLASYALVLLSLAPTIVYYLSLYQLGIPVGNIDTAGITGSYTGLILLAGIFSAIGVLASALTGNQIVSFILAAFLCFACYTGFDSIASINVWSDASYLIRRAGILSHYETLSKGLIDFSDVAYFVTMMALLLYFTRVVLNLQKK